MFKTYNFQVFIFRLVSEVIEDHGVPVKRDYMIPYGHIHLCLYTAGVNIGHTRTIREPRTTGRGGRGEEEGKRERTRIGPVIKKEGKKGSNRSFLALF